MIQGLPLLLDSLFGSKAFDQISLADIEALVTEFPSFNAGHYLLSKKLLEEKDERFDTQARKTALYFTNPLWLQLLLDPETAEEENDNEFQVIEPSRAVPADALGPIPAYEPADPEIFSAAEEQMIAEIDEIVTSPAISDDHHEALASDIADHADSDRRQHAETKAFHPDPYHDPIHELLPEIPAYNISSSLLHPEIAMPEDGTADPQEHDFADAVSETLDGRAGTEDHQAQEEERKQPAEAPLVMQAIAHFDSKKAESIVFEPYHVIDYFASQGIKLVIEENPKDSFTKQLKSFTDWLRVMKRIPDTPLTEEQQDREAEKIRHFAAHSIEEKDVLTETMAEVLAKQGMHANAAALYRKLSLLYPDKSAYFAARIEQLKPHSP